MAWSTTTAPFLEDVLFCPIVLNWLLMAFFLCIESFIGMNCCCCAPLIGLFKRLLISLFRTEVPDPWIFRFSITFMESCFWLCWEFWLTFWALSRETLEMPRTFPSTIPGLLKFLPSTEVPIEWEAPLVFLSGDYWANLPLYWFVLFCMSFTGD